MPSFGTTHGGVLQLSIPWMCHIRAAQRMLLPRPCVSSGHLLVRVTVATSSVPTLSPALRILTLPKAAGPFQGKMGCGERFCSCCVGLCWVLGTRGLIAGTLSDAALSPSYPAPTCLYLHRGAVLPVRIDLITSPLLKPKHICLVIIKSCPPPAPLGGADVLLLQAPVSVQMER